MKKILSVIFLLLSVSLFSGTALAQDGKLKISKVGGIDVYKAEKIVISKPMPINIEGSFSNIGDGFIYILQTGEGENGVYHIQPFVQSNELKSTYSGSVWFGTDNGLGNNKSFSLVAILVKNEIKLVDGDNPVHGIPKYITRSPKITIYRKDK